MWRLKSGGQNFCFYLQWRSTFYHKHARQNTWHVRVQTLKHRQNAKENAASVGTLIRADGTQIHGASVENLGKCAVNWDISLLYDLAIPFLSTYWRQMKYVHIKNYIAPPQIRGFIHNCQKLEMMQIFFNWWMDTKCPLPVRSGIWCGENRERAIDTAWMVPQTPWAKWQKLGPGGWVTYVSTLMASGKAEIQPQWGFQRLSLQERSNDKGTASKKFWGMMELYLLTVVVVSQVSHIA